MSAVLAITLSATVILGILTACALLKAGAEYDRNAERDARSSYAISPSQRLTQ